MTTLIFPTSKIFFRFFNVFFSKIRLFIPNWNAYQVGLSFLRLYTASIEFYSLWSIVTKQFWNRKQTEWNMMMLSTSIKSYLIHCSPTIYSKCYAIFLRSWQVNYYWPKLLKISVEFHFNHHLWNNQQYETFHVKFEIYLYPFE